MWTNFLMFLLINSLLISAQNIISGNRGHITCFKFGSLESCLEKVEKNTTSLKIEDSDIPRISRRAFEALGATLKSLSLNLCRIRKIDPEAFFGLTNLEKLDLSENSLTLLESTYLNYVPNLRHLDVSFNEIKAIDDLIFFNLQNLEDFYFDYNKVSAVSNRMFMRLQSDAKPKLNLRNVKIGRNPLNWEHRMLLTKRFDDLNINYQDDWENWNWLSSTIRDCQESGLLGLSSDQVLNCAIEKLLDFTQTNFDYSYTPCVPEASSLINCAKGNLSQLQNIDGVRYAFEGLGSIIKPMENPRSKFHKSPGYKTKLDHQVIHYNAGQQDWAWFEDVINSCSIGAFHEEQVLDCEVQQLLDFAFSIFEESGLIKNSTLCNTEVNNLLQCSKVSQVIDNITVRRSIQGFELFLPQMETSLGKLNL